MKRFYIGLGVLLLIGIGWWSYSNFIAVDTTDTSSVSHAAQTSNQTGTGSVKYSMGNPDAPVHMVEYIDILCPYCASFHQNTLPEITKNYIKSGKVFYEVRLVAMIAHDSRRAALGAYCAADQGMFWDYINLAYHDTYVNHYQQGDSPRDIDMFTGSNILTFASRVGVDLPRWEQCLAEETYADTLQENQQAMFDMQAYGTPYFVINDATVSGAYPYAVMSKIIESQLSAAQK